MSLGLRRLLLSNTLELELETERNFRMYIRRILIGMIESPKKVSSVSLDPRLRRSSSPCSVYTDRKIDPVGRSVGHQKPNVVQRVLQDDDCYM